MKSLLPVALRTAALFFITTSIALADDGGMATGAGLAVGLAGLGGGIGQGLCASGAIGGMARNPSVSGELFPRMMIGLALIESLVLLGFVIAAKLAGFF